MRTERRASLMGVAAVLVMAATEGCISDVTPNPLTLPRCSRLPSTCGSANNDSCCASDTVTGATYNRNNDPTLPARVVTFQLDRYEVTVGRFRAFVEGYALNEPASGAGADPSLGSASGWDPSWTAKLPADQAHLLMDVNCNGTYQTWTDKAGNDENAPINCVTWFEAFAFCAWDGGWLPTEAEWDYAATGGNRQNVYPWGNSPMPDMTNPNFMNAYAVYGCDTTSATPPCTLPPVGSKPMGAGAFGTLDLAGSVAEWNLDYFQDPIPPSPCGSTCAVLMDPGNNARVGHGGDFSHDSTELINSYRTGFSPGDVETILGFRCARAASP